MYKNNDKVKSVKLMPNYINTASPKSMTTGTKATAIVDNKYSISHLDVFLHVIKQLLYRQQNDDDTTGQLY